MHNLACGGIWWLGVFYGTSTEYHTCLPQHMRFECWMVQPRSIIPAYLRMWGGWGCLMVHLQSITQAYFSTWGEVLFTGKSTEYHTCLPQHMGWGCLMVHLLIYWVSHLLITSAWGGVGWGVVCWVLMVHLLSVTPVYLSKVGGGVWWYIYWVSHLYITHLINSWSSPLYLLCHNITSNSIIPQQTKFHTWSIIRRK